MSVCSSVVCVWQFGKGGRRYQFTQKHIFCGRVDEYLLTNKWGNQALGQSTKYAENKRAVSCRKYIAQNAKELGAVLTTSGYLSPSKSDRHQHSPDNLQNLYFPLRMKRTASSDNLQNLYLPLRMKRTASSDNLQNLYFAPQNETDCII